MSTIAVIGKPGVSQGEVEDKAQHDAGAITEAGRGS